MRLRRLSENAAHEPVDEVTTILVDGVPVRRYRVSGVSDHSPILLLFHGGGFVVGDVEQANPTARRLANRLSAQVLSVDYRLAPENPFPAGLDDGQAVLAWAAAQNLPLAVGGESAGGNLAANLAITARDLGISVGHQLLVYPWLDLTLTQPSVHLLAEGYYLQRSALQWFAEHYLDEAADRRDARVSPRYPTGVANVAPATIITVEYARCAMTERPAQMRWALPALMSNTAVSPG